RTVTVKENLNPEWDETFEFGVRENFSSLLVKVMDEDRTSDDFLGGFSVRLEDLKHKQRVTRWFKLRGKDDRLDMEHPRGELELSMQW
ncbi:unnamed protein product, partial [Discosporangium mesarthrocarpum]